MLTFDKGAHLSPPFNYILRERLSFNLRRSDVILLFRFINIVSIFVLYMY